MSTRIFLDGSNSWRRWSCSSQTWWFSLLIRRRSLGKSCLHQVPGQRRHRDTEDMGEMNRLEEGQMTPLCWWASLPGLNCLLLLDEGQMPLLCWWASLPGLNCPLPLACPSQQELLANNECLHFKPKQQSASCNRRVDRSLLVTIKGQTHNSPHNKKRKKITARYKRQKLLMENYDITTINHILHTTINLKPCFEF